MKNILGEINLALKEDAENFIIECEKEYIDGIFIIHLLFNVIGTVIFFVIFEFVPFPSFIKEIGNPSMQVSFLHIAFNVLSTVILLPFGDWLVRVSGKLTKNPLPAKSRERKHI